MTLRRGTMLTGLLMTLSLAACSGAYQQPEVEFEGVRIGGMGLRGGTLYAQILVTNPNRFDLETQSLTYDLEVADPARPGEWIRFTEGSLDERVRVEARGSRVLEVPITFQYDDVGSAMRSLLTRGSFAYRVSGDVRLREPIARTFPYRKQGTVSMGGVRD
ncbi:MAG TPA: LEA type 2 family protein [Longimicrobiales bacterium]|nr:LEA type 2 family protein [Longimicrobiales bacterium]